MHDIYDFGLNTGKVSKNLDYPVQIYETNVFVDYLLYLYSCKEKLYDNLFKYVLYKLHLHDEK